MLPAHIRSAIVNTPSGGRNIYDHLTNVAEYLPPSLRWRLVIEQDRRELATEIATETQPGDTTDDTCKRWSSTFEVATAMSKEEVRKKLIKMEDDRLKAVPLNVNLILTLDEKVRGTIRWNDYSKCVEFSRGVLAGFEDIETATTLAQNWIATRYDLTVNRTDIGYQIALAAQKNSYNPLHDYLFGLQWDGVPRIDLLFPMYFGTENTPHYRCLSRRWSIGCVARALPNETWCTHDGKKMGAKFDNIAILEGAQGTQKSSAWEVLGGKFYCASTIAIGDKDTKMVAASNWFMDAPELASFKKAETEVVKAATTTRTDTYRAPYGRGIIHTPRRCVMVSGTNEDHYLPDSTGNRRYWCIPAKNVNLAALARDRDQIWAEAVHIFLGEMSCTTCHTSTDTVAGQRPRCLAHRWWLDKDEEVVAAEIVSTRELDQPWMMWKDKIEAWWASMARHERPETVTAAEIASTVGKLETADRVTQSVLTAIGIAMGRAGFVRNPSKRCYTPSDALRTVRHRPQAASNLFGQSQPKTCKCNDCTGVPDLPGKILPIRTSN